MLALVERKAAGVLLGKFLGLCEEPARHTNDPGNFAESFFLDSLVHFNNNINAQILTIRIPYPILLEDCLKHE